MGKVSVTKTINISSNEAWALVSAFGNIDQISPIETSVLKADGNGIGRVCTMPDGAEIIEKLNRLDNNTQEIEYAILEGPFPITNYVSTVKVNKVDDNSSSVTWSCDYNSAPEVEADMDKLFEGFYNVIIDSIESKVMGVQA